MKRCQSHPVTGLCYLSRGNIANTEGLLCNKVSDRVTSFIRLYCYRMSESIVVLFNGGIKEWVKADFKLEVATKSEDENIEEAKGSFRLCILC
jgi:hypothetical protein